MFPLFICYGIQFRIKIISDIEIYMENASVLNIEITK